ncbi:MAG: NifU family protein [Sporolactobacillus sp.]
MYQQVAEAIAKLRPYLRRDGGDVELVSVVNGVVSVRLLGACEDCPSSTVTLKAGIEQALLIHVPGITEVRQVL